MLAPRTSIAIVDDEESIRVSMRRLCVAVGLTATTYASGQEFIAALDAGGACPDCLLLDAHMPRMTGLEVHQQLARRNVTFPTVIYTADDAPEAQARYRAAGVAEYLLKPIGADELLAALERVIAEHSPAKDARFGGVVAPATAPSIRTSISAPAYERSR
jgi:FixJ family two-component response regulator